MHILEISSLNYCETLDANFSVSRITSLSFCCKYRAIIMQTTAWLVTQHCKKRCPQVKKKLIKKLRQVLIICKFK